jgi:XRE family aerobic/anaerobic benzoate catabolism transcriptional regulator
VRLARNPRTLPNKSVRKSAPDAQANGRAAAGFLAALGGEVRRGRAKRGMTRRQLAQTSHTSERYLGEPVVHNSARVALLDAVAELPDHRLAELAQLIEARFLPSDRADRARRIALVGLRGAGKSTLGRMLARHLGCPFIELDRLVEQDYGASIPDMIEIAGTATFRRHERAALARVIAEHEAAVITTAGGIVSDRESYALLLRRSHTIWIKARPEEHMSRVMAQGDFRPMAQNREAMADLVAILDARGPDYARAQAQLDTSGEAAEQSFAKLLRISSDVLRPQS